MYSTVRFLGHYIFSILFLGQSAFWNTMYKLHKRKVTGFRIFGYSAYCILCSLWYNVLTVKERQATAYGSKPTLTKVAYYYKRRL